MCARDNYIILILDIIIDLLSDTFFVLRLG